MGSVTVRRQPTRRGRRLPPLSPSPPSRIPHPLRSGSAPPAAASGAPAKPDVHA